MTRLGITTYAGLLTLAKTALYTALSTFRMGIYSKVDGVHQCGSMWKHHAQHSLRCNLEAADNGSVVRTL